MPKYYGAFIVSKKPIDLSSVEKNLAGVQHLLYEEFDFGGNSRRNCWIVAADIQKYCDNQGVRILQAKSSTVSAVIINWFREFVYSMVCHPLCGKK